MPAPTKGTAPIDWANCGTLANYRRHLRLKEKPCKKCADHARLYNEDRRRIRALNSERLTNA